METPVKDLKPPERKEYIKIKIQGYSDWITTLRNKVNVGILSDENANIMIARAMTARDIKKELAEDKAKKDQLTGLYNKETFNKEYERLIKNGDKFALLILDLDNFKNINTNLGYSAGDSLIVQTALNISTNLRQLRESETENDFICRWGGDEFAVLLKNISEKKYLENVAEKLRKITSEGTSSIKTEKGIRNVPVTLSIGGGIYNNEGKETFFNKVNDGIKQAKTTKNKVVIIQ